MGLAGASQALREEAEKRFRQSGVKQRLFGEFRYAVRRLVPS